MHALKDPCESFLLLLASLSTLSTMLIGMRVVPYRVCKGLLFGLCFDADYVGETFSLEFGDKFHAVFQQTSLVEQDFRDSVGSCSSIAISSVCFGRISLVDGACCEPEVEVAEN